MTARKQARGKAPKVRHPGQILEEDWLLPNAITQAKLAKHLGMSRMSLNTLIRGRRSISPRMAWMLAQVFRIAPEYWLGIQMAFDLAICKKRPTLKPLLNAKVLS